MLVFCRAPVSFGRLLGAPGLLDLPASLLGGSLSCLAAALLVLLALALGFSPTFRRGTALLGLVALALLGRRLFLLLEPLFFLPALSFFLLALPFFLLAGGP